MTLRRLDLLRYGLLGLPLAFVALPLYVILPNHYARSFGVPLAALGAVLLGARLFDAFVDPLLGRLGDRLQARSPRAVLGFGALAAGVLALGFTLLFFPQWLVDTTHHAVLLALAAGLLAVTYAGYSALGIAHQSWGAMLGGDALQRSRIVGWREGLGLVGVVLASVVPTVAGLPVTVALFIALLALGVWMWTRAPRPARPDAEHAEADLRLPLRRPAFRRLLAVFVLNGIASAIPATLVLFFVQDRLQAPPAFEPAVLGSYFVCAAASIPLWLRAVPRFGLARCWLAGMALAIAVFAWAGAMGAGDAVPFLVVCALSGVALGADLVL
ncbi:MAG: MFS transporter, partial [Comamonadaceae bacterium]